MDFDKFDKVIKKPRIRQSITVDADKYEALQKELAKQGKKFSDFIEFAMDEYLEHLNKNK